MDRVSDLEFFTRLVRQGSLAALARELGVTPPAVTARLAQLEKRLGVRLLNRTTRRLSVTHEGEIYLATGARLLEELEALEQAVSSSRGTPKGLLRVNATFGFGRRHIAPAIVEFARRYPEVEVQLELTDRSVNLADKAFDIGIWFGTVPDSRMVARKLVSNRRLLCASPGYLARAGVPQVPRDLQSHACIVLRESDAAYGTWYLTRGSKHETVKVRGPLSTNDGETGVLWALAGYGILMRSEWDIHAQVRDGRLVPVLTDWTLPVADVFAVYPERANLSAKVSAFIDFLSEWFQRDAAWADRR
ncbi:LysR family transcriptional regulator [Ralstonia mannitolilytica]|uniref:HTH-type transcriptional regulator DmlR n=1 Tax=Ralstonia mannitolilytica TaxID=105219 RepID=A0AAD2AIU2_9RALS|nr:LysR family transcriptional regulator [Ralstonia mannitolilytica]MBY4716967.1 LysR family transcriptional regulator [Ralstonia mannitolilytica]CAJ0680592.1 HTH-type transcriptional regulator DmlR [Ralstonia mannitolilytica]CAJ0716548.1 HTH-type transcriptional regulator DmlR [Ralstonia mannitolilytica]CAJ0863234.1 HTH-type transcriptional regulator DmlR [Ralstonia mannitolilytica]